jgi:hypothetical protein
MSESPSAARRPRTPSKRAAAAAKQKMEFAMRPIRVGQRVKRARRGGLLQGVVFAGIVGRHSRTGVVKRRGRGQPRRPMAT